MRKKIYILLFILEVITVYLASTLQKSSGYMDADYYYANSINIANGKGFIENFVWNYLDNPNGIPHPSFSYWMPLASIVSSTAIFLSGNTSFQVSRIPFFLLSGFIPILAMHITFRISGETRSAWMAGLFSIFSGFYLIYIGLPETFLLYMLLGACFFEVGMVLFNNSRRFKKLNLFFCAISGALAGLFVLTRADGLLWTAAGVGLIFYCARELEKQKQLWKSFSGTLCLLAGFGVVTTGWYVRNLAAFGSWMAPGGISTLWLTDYNQTFIYPSFLLTFSNWWQAGILAHLAGYLSAFWKNLQTLLIVQGEIFLVPLIIIAFIKYRNIRLLKYFSLILALQFFVSTLIFPFSGSRGGYFHSGSAFQIIFWALAGIGFWVLLEWGVAKRGWQLNRSAKMFIPAIIFLVLLFSGIVYWQKVIGSDPANPAWDQEHVNYQDIESKLLSSGFKKDQEILIGNPPGYYIATGRPAFVIPDGDLNTLENVAQRYSVEILALDENHPKGLDSFYSQAISQRGFTFLFRVGKYQVYSYKSN